MYPLSRVYLVPKGKGRYIDVHLLKKRERGTKRERERENLLEVENVCVCVCFVKIES